MSRVVQTDGGTLIGGQLLGTTTIETATVTALNPATVTQTAGSVAPILSTAKSTELTTAGAGTYTPALLLGGYIVRDPNGAARTDTTATATAISAANTSLGIGSFFDFCVDNIGAATEDITFEGGTGVTGATGTASIGTIEDGETAWFRCLKTTTTTYTIAQLSL